MKRTFSSTETLTDVRVVCPAAESDGDSSEWPMEQEEAIDGLLCETPSLLPTLSLSLASSEGPQAPEGPTVAPAAAAASPAQTTASSHNHGKGIKVRNQRLMMNFFSEFFSVFHCVLLQLFSLLPPVSLVPFTDKRGEYHPSD